MCFLHSISFKISICAIDVALGLSGVKITCNSHVDNELYIAYALRGMFDETKRKTKNKTNKPTNQPIVSHFSF